MAGPRQIVDAPTFTPSEFGLLSVVETPITEGSHWQNGVTWISYCMEDEGDSTYDECLAVTGAPLGIPPEPPTKTDNVEQVFRGATPFTAYVRFDCAPVGNEQARQVAEQALARSEHWQVERTFWTGLAGGQTVVFPHLAANASVEDTSQIVLQSAATPVVTGTAALDPVVGLGLLEDALGECYGGRGVIHIPTKLLPTLDQHGLLRVTNARNVGTGRFSRQLQTLKGNLVAVGDGYPGTSPSGVDPGDGSTWIYATGAVFLRRGDVKVHGVADSLDRTNNNLVMIAERTYVIGFDCCHLAVHVDLGTS